MKHVLLALLVLALILAAVSASCSGAEHYPEGCVPGSTIVLTTNGELKPIREVRDDELVQYIFDFGV